MKFFIGILLFQMISQSASALLINTSTRCELKIYFNKDWEDFKAKAVRILERKGYGVQLLSEDEVRPGMNHSIFVEGGDVFSGTHQFVSLIDGEGNVLINEKIYSCGVFCSSYKATYRKLIELEKCR